MTNVEQRSARDQRDVQRVLPMLVGASALGQEQSVTEGEIDELD